MPGRMVGLVLRALAALAVFAAPGMAAAAPARERAGIDFALERGRLLFELDRAAWVATDDMVARLPEWRTAGLAGYVAERIGDGFTVTFYGGPDEVPVAFDAARVEKRRVESHTVFPAAARPPLTAAQLRLVAAREAARKAFRRQPCAEAPFNAAVIPPAAPNAPIDVYMLTPQVKNGEYPLGGHYRLTVAADGKVSERAFTKSCLTMPQPPGEAAGLVVSHLLDPVPTEIHVFTAMTASVPVYVAVQQTGRLYEVTGERIRLVKKR